MAIVRSFRAGGPKLNQGACQVFYCCSFLSFIREGRRQLTVGVRLTALRVRDIDATDYELVALRQAV